MQRIYCNKATSKTSYIREYIFDVVKYECSESLTGIFFINSKTTNFYSGIASTTFGVRNMAVQLVPHTLFIRIEYDFVGKQTEIGCGLIFLQIFK